MSVTRRTTVAACTAALCFGATTSAAEPGEAVPLFSSEEPIAVTIRAPFGEILEERSKEEDVDGTFTYVDPAQGEVSFVVGIRTRGNFRHKSDTCPFAPLRLDFGKKQTAGTVFDGAKKLKLVTHCRNRSLRHTQSLLREHLAYRILNRLTDYSFRVRLLEINYVDSANGESIDSNYGFLIEHRNQLARRIGLDVNKAEKSEIDELVSSHTNLVSLFQYLIGNTDFSPIRGPEGEMCCHNYVLFGSEPGSMLSIPYDFDMSGIVDAAYAEPNPRFNLRSVKTRLYRGRCVNNGELEQSVAAFLARREEIYALVTEPDWFAKASRRQTLRYLDEFYDTIGKPSAVQFRIASRCLG